MDATTGKPPAAVTGKPPASVLESLLAKPKTFSFIQAVRLLLRQHADAWESTEDFLRHGLAISPDLSLAHPGTDITDLRRKAPEEDASCVGEETDPCGADVRQGAARKEDAGRARARYAMTVTFLSLYGASSPLPAFYTEELIEEARNDHDESRRFLDIFNQALYVLYYRAFTASKLGLRSLEEKDERLADLLQALSGFGLPGLARAAQTSCADLACIPLLTRHTRSADGLEAILQFVLGRRDIAIEQCLPRSVPVPSAQRARLGSMRLGEDVIGCEVADLEGAFRIHVYNVRREELALFLPEGRSLYAMHAIVRRYLYQPLAFDLVLHMAANAPAPARLGAARLGISAFLCEKEQAPQRCLRISAQAIAATARAFAAEDAAKAGLVRQCLLPAPLAGSA